MPVDRRVLPFFLDVSQRKVNQLGRPPVVREMTALVDGFSDLAVQ